MTPGLTGTSVAGTHVESRPSLAKNEVDLASGQQGEWDFALKFPSTGGTHFYRFILTDRNGARLAPLEGMAAIPWADTVTSKLVFTHPMIVAVAGACTGPLTVQVQDLAGLGRNGGAAVEVTLTSSSPGARFFPAAGCAAPVTTLTLGAGASSVDFYWIDTVAGAPTHVAAATGLSSAMRIERVEPGPATSLTVSGVPSPIEAGAPADVLVEARDAFGNLATAYTGTVGLSSSDDSATLAGPAGFVLIDAGRKNLAGAVRFASLGAQTITARDEVAPQINGSQSDILVIATGSGPGGIGRPIKGWSCGCQGAGGPTSVWLVLLGWLIARYPMRSIASRNVARGLRLTLACAALLPIAARGAAPENRAPFEAADRYYQNLEFSDAARLYEQALAGGALSRTLLLRAYVGVALSTAVLLQKEQAVWAFKRVLALDPLWQLPSYAGPKLAQPFEQARAWWKDRSPPLLRATHDAEAFPGEALVVQVELRSDPLELARVARMKWKLGAVTGEERSPIAKRLRLTVPAGAVMPGTIELIVEALDEQGSVVLEAGPSRVTVRAAAPTASVESDPPPPPRAAVPPAAVAKAAASSRESKPPAPAESIEPEADPFLHLYAAVFGLFPQRAMGGEVGAGISPGRFLDVGAAVIPGSNTGGQLNLTLHPGRRGRVLRPFVQVRGIVSPLPTGIALGAGLCVGGFWELGPGRVIGGVAAEGYYAPLGYGPYAILILGGYQLDVL